MVGDRGGPQRAMAAVDGARRRGGGGQVVVTEVLDRTSHLTGKSRWSDLYVARKSSRLPVAINRARAGIYLTDGGARSFRGDPIYARGSAFSLLRGVGEHRDEELAEAAEFTDK